jgi:inhibitor of the pro-sigma K processing machinery
MDMHMEIGILLAYAFGVLVLYVIGYVFLVPIRILLKLIANSVVGGIFILIVNFAGAPFGVLIPLNLFTSVLVGILGVPGALLIFILTRIL